MKVKLLSSIVLREGIAHIEDLSLREFIRTIESMKDKIVTEKLDGANLWFGLDDRGLFTSREGKSSKGSRFYDVSDYAVVASYNGFRAAHLAIEKVENTIRKYLKVGDTVEMEVLFGRQPNTVTYGVEGKSFIVIIRGVNSTPEERVQNLANALNNKQVTVESTIVSSIDGDRLDFNDEKLTWEFTKVAPIAAENINTKEAMKLLDELKKFSKHKNRIFKNLTNGEVAEVSLTSLPKEKRPIAKNERERLRDYILTHFKLPIKELLLNHFVRKIKPMLQSSELDPSEDIGIEGVVVRDPVTGSQSKIVDRDVFTAVNVFNSTVRANIAGLVRTTDQDAPIESRGGVFGDAKIRIAKLLGRDELALSSGAKRYLTKFKKSDPYSTALAVANDLNIKSLSSTRTKISSILKHALTEVDGILKQFKEEAGEFKLELKTGKEIGISPEIMKRTLTAFAETKKDINEINSKVLASRSPADLVLALYGRTIESLFKGDGAVTESYKLIKSIQEDDGGGDAGGGDAGGATGSEATGSCDVAAHPQRVFYNYKIVVKRPRGFKRKKKFSKPSYDLIKAVSEDASSNKFATDVDDTATANKDVEFKQLRNNVNMGTNITQMDVNRYLNKAHELNDEVDTVTFGMELDDGSIVKVYVNATQADKFEHALSQLLGKEDDVEEAINTLADSFDIVDVEWPHNMQDHNVDQASDASIDTPDSDDDTIDDENSEIDLTIFGDDDEGDSIDGEENESTEEIPSDDASIEGGEESTDDVEGEESSEEGDEPGEESTDDESSEEPSEERDEGDDSEGDEESDESEEDDDDSEEEEEIERDDFGQIVKKKKKKETTEESLKQVDSLLKQAVLLEAEGQTKSFTNPAVQAVSDMLAAMGFDLDANRSFAQQARILQSRNTLGIRAARNSVVANKIRIARDALAQMLDVVTPDDQESTQQNQSFSLLGSIISEAEGKWIVGDLGDLGMQLSTRGLHFKIDNNEAEKLALALENHREVSVLSTRDKRFEFIPDEDGYLVKEKDSSKIPKRLPTSEIDKVLKALSDT